MAWNKFGAKRVARDGYWFDSKLEESVYGILKLRQSAGEISDIVVKDRVLLTRAEISYKADFSAIDNKTKEKFWIEAKGMDGERWRVIRKLWTIYGPGKLEIWKGTAVKPYIEKIIIPQ